jgi:O-methyltransferase domain
VDKIDSDAVTVLRNCLAAMNARGRILVIDPMLPEANQPHPNWFRDILMMAITTGHCRTRGQFKTLFNSAGLELTRVIATASPNFIIEGMPK